jgi:hypothetical protein
MLSLNAHSSQLLIIYNMVSDKRRQYLREYRAKGGEAYKAYQALAQRKHRANNLEKRRNKGRESSRTYRQRKAEQLQRLILIEKMILQFVKTTPTNEQTTDNV